MGRMYNITGKAIISVVILLALVGLFAIFKWTVGTEWLRRDPVVSHP